MEQVGRNRGQAPTLRITNLVTLPSLGPSPGPRIENRLHVARLAACSACFPGTQARAHTHTHRSRLQGSFTEGTGLLPRAAGTKSHKLGN